jgi:hypothetical protein
MLTALIIFERRRYKLRFKYVFSLEAFKGKLEDI